MADKVLRILSGGAAQALVRRLQPAFEAAHGCRIEATFGAVGAMKDRLLAGEPCDLLVLTDPLITDLSAQGRAVASTARQIGLVKTGVALKADAPAADVSTPEALKALLLRSGGVYFPDPAKATAGIHFMKVLAALGLVDALAARLRTFPNGATAMAQLAQAPEPDAVGCTQVTEIRMTPGVRLAGLLPPPHGLTTIYTAAVCSQATEAALAVQLTSAMAGASTELRECGFE